MNIYFYPYYFILNLGHWLGGKWGLKIRVVDVWVDSSDDLEPLNFAKSLLPVDKSLPLLSQEVNLLLPETPVRFPEVVANQGLLILLKTSSNYPSFFLSQ